MIVSAFRRACAIAAAVGVAFGFAAIAAPVASAASYPSMISSSYKGYAYVVSPTVTVNVWGYSPGEWLPGGMLSGETVYTAPFANGWSWAFSESSWFAVRTSSLARWSCTRSNATVTIKQRAVAYRYNSTITMDYGVIGPNTQVQLYCSSTFPDAATTPGSTTAKESMVLVKARPMPKCVYPERPTDPICMVAEPAGGWPEHWVYVKRSSLDAPAA